MADINTDTSYFGSDIKEILDKPYGSILEVIRNDSGRYSATLVRVPGGLLYNEFYGGKEVVNTNTFLPISEIEKDFEYSS